MRPFAEWLSASANSIEDASHFVKKCFCAAAKEKTIAPNSLHPMHPLYPSQLQLRVMLANSVVPFAQSLGTLHDWMTVFMVSLSEEPLGFRVLKKTSLEDLIGKDLAKQYSQVVSSIDLIEFTDKLRAGIRDGTIK